MPRPVPHTSPEARQHLRQHYYATSENEAGLIHLWHLQRLATIRLNPGHTIQDAPDVDFANPSDPAVEYNRRLNAEHYALQLKHDEAQIYAQNLRVLEGLTLTGDPKARVARHMNMIPTAAEVARFDNIQEQTSHRARDRMTEQKHIVAENQRFLGHLITVAPHVRTAKELDTWYNTVHRKRLAQLSRFKPAEPFAGARVLEGAANRSRSRGSAGSRDGSLKRRRSRTAAAAAAAGVPYYVAAELAASPPLLRGHPFPPLSVAEASRTAPASLLPVVRTTSYGGVPLALEDPTSPPKGLRGDHGSPTAASPTGTLEESCRPSLQPPRTTARPDWQPVSATDIPLLHYAADLQLRRDGGGGTSTRARGNPRAHTAPQPRHQQQLAWSPSPGHDQAGSSASPATGGVRLVAPEEEGGVTQMWRGALMHRKPPLLSAHPDAGADRWPVAAHTLNADGIASSAWEGGDGASSAQRRAPGRPSMPPTGGADLFHRRPPGPRQASGEADASQRPHSTHGSDASMHLSGSWYAPPGNGPRSPATPELARKRFQASATAFAPI